MRVASLADWSREGLSIATSSGMRTIFVSVRPFTFIMDRHSEGDGSPAVLSKLHSHVLLAMRTNSQTAPQAPSSVSIHHCHAKRDVYNVWRWDTHACTNAYSSNQEILDSGYGQKRMSLWNCDDSARLPGTRYIQLYCNQRVCSSRLD